MSFVAFAATVGGGSALLGGAIIGAGIGGTYSALTGDGDVLNSMLTGALIGGAGTGGLSAMGVGATGTTSVGIGTGAAGSFGTLSAAPTAGTFGTLSTGAAPGAATGSALTSGLKVGTGSALIGTGSAGAIGSAVPVSSTLTPAASSILGSTGAGSAAAGLTGPQMLGYGLAGSSALSLLGNQNRTSAGGNREEDEYTKRLKGYKLSSDYQPYRAPQPNPYYRPTYAADGGVMNSYDDEAGMDMAGGGIAGLGGYSDGGRMLKGPGDGMSDSIPGIIGGKQPARLADGEFVIPADVVSHLGNGSTDAGAKRLYSMMDDIRKARTGRKKQAPEINVDKYLPGNKKASGGIAGYADGGVVGYSKGGKTKDEKSKDEFSFDDLSKAEQKYFLELMARPMGNNPPPGSDIGQENSFEKYMMSQAPQGFQGRVGVKKEFDSDRGQYRPASLKAGLSGIAIADPQKRGIKAMPGAFDIGYRSAQRSQEDPYFDIMAYRSLQAAPGRGYAQGVNANYTIPFANGGTGGYAEGGVARYNDGGPLATNIQNAYNAGYSGSQIGAALIAEGVTQAQAAAATGLSADIIAQVYAGGAQLNSQIAASGGGIGDPGPRRDTAAAPVTPVTPVAAAPVNVRTTGPGGYTVPFFPPEAIASYLKEHKVTTQPQIEQLKLIFNLNDAQITAAQNLMRDNPTLVDATTAKYRADIAANPAQEAQNAKDLQARMTQLGITTPLIPIIPPPVPLNPVTPASTATTGPLAGSNVYRPTFVPRTSGVNMSDAIKDPYSNAGLESLYSQMMAQYEKPAAPKSDTQVRELIQRYIGNGAETGRQLINAGIPVNQTISALKSYPGITPEIVNQAYIGGESLGTAPPPTLNTQYNYSDPATYYRPPSPNNLILTRPIVDAAFTPPAAAPAPTELYTAPSGVVYGSRAAYDAATTGKAGGLMSINRKKRAKTKPKKGILAA